MQARPRALRRIDPAPERPSGRLLRGGGPASAGEALFLETECSPGPRELGPSTWSVPWKPRAGRGMSPVGSGRDKALLSSSSGKDGGAPGPLIGRPHSTPPAPCIQWVRGCGMPSTDAGAGTVNQTSIGEPVDLDQ